MNCRCYGNFKAVSPTISRAECAWWPVIGFPQFLLRTRNNAHETFRVHEQGTQQDTCTCCCLLRPSPPELHRCRHLPPFHTANWTLAVNKGQQGLLNPDQVFTCQQEQLRVTQDHGGIIYDRQLRSSKQACKQTAILTREQRSLFAGAKQTANRLPFCVQKQTFKWQFLRNTIRYSSSFLQFTSIEETSFPSNEQFINNRSHKSAQKHFSGMWTASGGLYGLSFPMTSKCTLLNFPFKTEVITGADGLHNLKASSQTLGCLLCRELQLCVRLLRSPASQRWWHTLQFSHIWMFSIHSELNSVSHNLGGWLLLYNHTVAKQNISRPWEHIGRHE